jgi:hypothetical protein
MNLRIKVDWSAVPGVLTAQMPHADAQKAQIAQRYGRCSSHGIQAGPAGSVTVSDGGRPGRTRGPTTAVYITWDTHGRCRYVGSVRRPRSRAVRARLAEHLRTVERRGTCYTVTVLPMRADLSLEVVRQCEGIVAQRLSPVDGSAHPVPSTVRSLGNLVAPQLVGRASS